MKVLFATTNPAKIKRYVEELEKRNIEVVTIKDLGINLHVEETGKNAIENAYIKAKAYYDATGITTIGMDNNLFIEELPDEKQPGTHVRRVNGKELKDEEMIDYYTKLVKEYGGKLTARWVYGMVIYNGKEVKEYSWSKSNFYFVDTPSEKRNPGYPLDSMSIMPECNKYFVDLTQEDRNKNKQNYNEDDVIDFIIKTLYK
jgi:8-oxo-dGTP diphosphatase